MKNYKRFGVMLDMSRNAVMGVEQVKRFMDTIKKFGYNALGLYMEDTYEIKSEPYFGYMRGRYTGAELKEIDAHGQKIGIEVIPYIQTLAHLNSLTKHEIYEKIFDIDDVLLIDEPKTYELIEKMFKTCAENFTTRTINIGMDEAFKVGLGKYLDKHGYQNRYDTLLRHLNKVVEIATKYGFKPVMWSDMFFRLACGDYYKPVTIPENVKQLVPKEVGLEYWDYYHKDKQLYDGMFKSHKEFDREISFAGGAWCWHGFAPLAGHSLRTMKPALQSVVEHGIENVMITMWGDGGHECSFYTLLHVLYAIRQYGDGNFDDDKIKEGFKSLTGYNFDDFMLLDLPNLFDYDEIMDEPHNPCRVLLYSDIFMGLYDKNLANNGSINYGEYAQKIADAKSRAGEHAYVFDYIEKLCSALELKANMGLELRSAYKSGDKEKLKTLNAKILELAQRVKDFHKSLSFVWHKENKPFGFEVHDARLGGLVMRLHTCYQRLEDYLSGKVCSIPELEQEVLEFGDGKALRHYAHSQIITSSEMAK